MPRRVWTLISTLTLVVSVAGPAQAQTAPSDEAPQSSIASQVSPKLRYEPTTGSVSVANPLKGTTEGIFVIRLEAEPLATYRGGVAGIAATSPLQTGADKLDTTTTASRDYVRYLEAYPAEKRQRRERFAEVMAGQRDYSAEELDGELNDLRRTLAALGAAAEQELSADQFLELLRNKARLLEQPGSEGERLDLAEAIRRELQAG